MITESLTDRTWSRLATLAVAVSLVTGCYTYRAVDTAPPGSEIRARLTTEAAVRRSAGLDNAVMQIDGRMVRESADAIKVNVLLMRDPSQFANVEIRDTISLRRADVESLMVRELSTSRSILFIGALGAAGFAMFKGYQAVAGGAEGNPDDGGGNQASVVPLFSLRLSPFLLLTSR